MATRFRHHGQLQLLQTREWRRNERKRNMQVHSTFPMAKPWLMSELELDQ